MARRKDMNPNEASRASGGLASEDLGKHMVTVTVNEQPVKLEGREATGAQIKAGAIAQGVHIAPNFVLQEELPNGTSRIIGDNDEVHLREHLRFTAIAPDDNS
jgi:multiubiquitin